MKTFKRFVAASLFILPSFIPVSAFALEGIGPRATITGTVEELRLTKEQAFDQEGGELIITARNGQVVTVVIEKETEIISEGRLSRKLLIPANITPGMEVRVRGWRLGSASLKAGLIIILNLEVNPSLSANGTITSIDGNTLTVLSSDGKTRSFRVTNETEVNISYTVYGSSGLSLLGKSVLLTLNPLDPTAIRILRITGEPPPTPTVKPPSIR